MTAAERKRRASRRAAGVCTDCAGPLPVGGWYRCPACYLGKLEDSPLRRRVKNRKDWNCAVCGVVLCKGETIWRVTCYGDFRTVVRAKKYAVCDPCYGSIPFRKENVAVEAKVIAPEPADHRGGRPKKKRGKERRRARRLQRRGRA